jgi:hypothetical protein
MATFTTTTKYALRWLTGTNLISDIDAGFQALAEDIDANMAGYTSGTQAARPAAGVAGRIYRATDLAGGVALDTGTAWVSIGAARVTSLPTVNLYDGQTVDFVADGTNGVIWRLRYNASGGTYKWEFDGGGPLTAEVSTAETTNTGAYGDLTTVGPSIVVPLAGDYEVTYGAKIAASQTTTAQGGAVAPKFGTAAVDGVNDDAEAVAAGVGTPSGGWRSQALRTIRRNIPAASSTVKLQYTLTFGGTVTFSRRNLSIKPIRVG